MATWIVKDNSLCIFQNYLLFAFSTIIPPFFRPRSWSDFIDVPMTHNPCLSDMSKRVHRFPLFSNKRLASHKGHICARALAWPYSSDSYKASLVFQTVTTHAGECGLPHVMFISSLPRHAALSLSLSPLFYSL
ncbi:unnamed protein product [Hymenolepis diminuta]|uniref:Uncharacterized protein n=1 Tax=Hymenolepis diminuta TaxID=6216 RepID=A0A564YBD2_HYMDI|nr:unnamed protein product [Hymenolepis diminuta]